MCKGSLDRDPQVMRKNMLVAGRVLRQAHPLAIMAIGSDHPPDCTHLSKLRCATGQLGQPLLPPCRASMLDLFHLGGKSSAGGRRGPGEVSARTEMLVPAIFAVRGSDRGNGLRTARMAGAKFAVRISHPDLYVLRTGRGGGGAPHGAVPPTAHDHLHSVAAAGRERLVGARLAIEARPPRDRTRCRRLQGLLHLKSRPGGSTVSMPNFPFRVMCAIRDTSPSAKHTLILTTTDSH